MKVNVYHDCIYEVEDFLSQDQLEPLLTTASAASPEEWFREDYPAHWNGKTFALRSNGHEEQALILDGVLEYIKTYISNATSYIHMAAIHRFKTGDILAAHRDNAAYGDHDNQLGIVVYLNDTFEGGELYYPDLDFRIKPKANSMVVHPAGLLHQVLKITDGVRYTLTTFVSGDESTKFIGENDAI